MRKRAHAPLASNSTRLDSLCVCFCLFTILIHYTRRFHGDTYPPTYHISTTNRPSHIPANDQASKHAVPLVFLIYEIPWHDLSSSYLSNHLHCCTAYATCARTVAYNDTTHAPPTRLLVSGMERMDILYVPAYNMMERLVTYLPTYLLTT